MLLFLAFAGCGKGGGTADDDDDSGTSAQVNARIETNTVSPRIGTISESISLNATTQYMLNDIVRAPMPGYIRKVYVTVGQDVKQGDELFSIQSKEASAIQPDSLFPSKGIMVVKATEAGIVKEVDRQLGDYMQDGDQFCTIADKSSMVFILNVPFEIHQFIESGHSYSILLADGESLRAQIASQIPQMDRTVQMERYVLKTLTPVNLPEGLIGRVIIPTVNQKNAVILPKTAVLSDETQKQFWVMKALNDSIAVRVNVVNGISTKDSVEIRSPAFTEKDRILVTGNYGVPDTVKIKIVKP